MKFLMFKTVQLKEKIFKCAECKETLLDNNLYIRVDVAAL